MTETSSSTTDPATSFNDDTNTGVSKTRKRISSIVLVILLVVLAIEGRAGLGHMMAGKALKAKAPEGVFAPYLSVGQLESMLMLFPSKVQVGENMDETEYRYGWLSLLRPVLGRPEAAYYITFFKADPPFATRYSEQAPE